MERFERPSVGAGRVRDLGTVLAFDTALRLVRAESARESGTVGGSTAERVGAGNQYCGEGACLRSNWRGWTVEIYYHFWRELVRCVFWREPTRRSECGGSIMEPGELWFSILR